MKRALIVIVITALIGLVAGGGGFLWVERQAHAPGPHDLDVRIVIEPGQGVASIAAQLRAEGLIAQPMILRLWARHTGQHTSLRAGEYDVPARASVVGILELLHSGKTVVRKLTLPEGVTSLEALALVREAEGLTGALVEIPGDGGVLPETYHYSRGDARVEIARRMRVAMEEAVHRLWAQRPEGFILKSPEELVTLASIVEKETALPEERPMIAGVFLNRLKRGMRLQSDPTVVYALTNGQGPLGRALTRADLKTESPYNTYAIKGLPPGPIANPGLASLQAVMNPADTDALYFVADGSGGHVFARTLKAHNKNVAKWRKFKRTQNGE